MRRVKIWSRTVVRMTKQSVQGVEEHVDLRTDDALGQTLREGATPVVTDNARAVGSAGKIADTARLVASPNPVPAGSGAGLTTITWAVPGATDAEVWVSVNAQPERHWSYPAFVDRLILGDLTFACPPPFILHW